MPSTRHAKNQDIAHAPERNLSDLAHRTINIPLSTVAMSARIYPHRVRNASWLCFNALRIRSKESASNPSSSFDLVILNS